MSQANRTLWENWLSLSCGWMRSTLVSLGCWFASLRVGFPLKSHSMFLSQQDTIPENRRKGHAASKKVHKYYKWPLQANWTCLKMDWNLPLSSIHERLRKLRVPTISFFVLIVHVQLADEICHETPLNLVFSQFRPKYSGNPAKSQSWVRDFDFDFEALEFESKCLALISTHRHVLQGHPIFLGGVMKPKLG